MKVEIKIPLGYRKVRSWSKTKPGDMIPNMFTRRWEKINAVGYVVHPKIIYIRKTGY